MSTLRYSSYYIPWPLLWGGRYNCFDVTAVWIEIFSENDFSVMVVIGCNVLYTRPSMSEVHHTTSTLVSSYCLTISLGR